MLIEGCSHADSMWIKNASSKNPIRCKGKDYIVYKKCKCMNEELKL